VEQWGCRLADKDRNEFLGRWVLGDTLVIKAYKNLYFVNVKEGDHWVLRLIRPQAPGIMDLLSIDLQNENVRARLLRQLKSNSR
jgi:hypothetical protein